VVRARLRVRLFRLGSFARVFHGLAGVPFYPRGYPMEERWPKVRHHILISFFFSRADCI
jgi:hypothetical protein